VPSRDLALPAQSFEHDMHFGNVLNARFLSHALSMGARCIRGTGWSTTTLFPHDAPDVIVTAYYDFSRTFEALTLTEGVLALVHRTGDSVSVKLAGDSPESLARAEANLRERLPEVERSSPHRVAVDFSHLADHGVEINSRMIPVPTLGDIEHNYSSSVRTSLRALAHEFDPESSGRLILWHGLPGCGKTWALRALASEWRQWCRLRYVTDPEAFLGAPEYLINLLHMRHTRLDDESWVLVVLEDTGELLGGDARHLVGQGLSRLLNVVDGLLGDTARALFLITTNEDLRVLHPALARPGRCGHLLEFGPLPVADANMWLERAGSEHRVGTPATLAELFAVRDGSDLRAARRRTPGFV
jgi:hypothetical protein